MMHIYYALINFLYAKMIMRTTLDLPETLLDEALKVSYQKTKTAVIITALEDYVRKSKIQGLKKYRGSLDLDIDLNALRKRG